MMSHGYKLRDDGVVLLVKLFTELTIEIAALDCELNPHLCFGSLAFRIAELTDECRLILALAPGLGQIGANGARRSTDLIGQRISFLDRKRLAGLKELHSGLESALVNVQFRMLPHSRRSTVHAHKH